MGADNCYAIHYAVAYSWDKHHATLVTEGWNPGTDQVAVHFRRCELLQILGLIDRGHAAAKQSCQVICDHSEDKAIYVTLQTRVVQ